MRFLGSKRRLRGVTLTEVVIAAAIGATMILVLGEVVDMTTRTQAQITMQDRVSAAGNEMFATVRSAAFSSRRLYVDDAEGQSFFAALDTSAYPPLPGTRLPDISPTGRLEPDAAGGTETGNSLLLAVAEPPLEVALTGRRVWIDRVRLVCFYPAQRNGRVVRAFPDRVDLVRFVSEVYADRSSLDVLTDPADLGDAVTALRADGVRFAWVSGRTADQSFFQLNSDGTVGAAPQASPAVAPAPAIPPRALLGASTISFARNDPSLSVPRYAQPVAGVPEFPGGFEVKVVGPSGGRQVLVRLVMIAGTPLGHDLVSDVLKIFAVRDL